MPTTTRKFVTWLPLYRALKDTGVLEDPTTVRRIVIDATVGEACTITFEHYADDRMFDIARAVEVVEAPGLAVGAHDL